MAYAVCTYTAFFLFFCASSPACAMCSRATCPIIHSHTQIFRVNENCIASEWWKNETLRTTAIEFLPCAVGNNRFRNTHTIFLPCSGTRHSLFSVITNLSSLVSVLSFSLCITYYYYYYCRSRRYYHHHFFFLIHICNAILALTMGQPTRPTEGSDTKYRTKKSAILCVLCASLFSLSNVIECILQYNI